MSIHALEKLRKGESVSALWLSMGSIGLAEIAVECQPDCLVIDRQHGLWDAPSMHHALGHVRGRATTIVRVAANRPELIGEALDAGADGVLIPLIDNAQSAALAVAAAHYPPRGIRSGGGVRPLAQFKDYVAKSAQGTLVALMIETVDGLENAEAIIATPGVDLIFIGPGDLALSLGERAPEALETSIQHILSLCQVARVPCGIFTLDVAAARMRLQQGFTFVVADDDIRLARNGFRQSLAAIAAEHGTS